MPCTDVERDPDTAGQSNSIVHFSFITIACILKNENTKQGICLQIAFISQWVEEHRSVDFFVYKLGKVFG